MQSVRFQTKTAESERVRLYRPSTPALCCTIRKALFLMKYPRRFLREPIFLRAIPFDCRKSFSLSILCRYPYPFAVFQSLCPDIAAVKGPFKGDLFYCFVCLFDGFLDRVPHRRHS